MNIDKNNLDKARELLAELSVLEDVRNLLDNYDAQAHAVYSTKHNNNTHQYKEVRIKMPPEAHMAMKDYIARRIDEIHKELETL